MQRDGLLLAEIVAAGDRAASIVASHSREDIGSTGDARDALLWNMAVIGEAVTQLSDDLRHAHSSIPWQAPVSLRNRVIHGYWSIDMDVVYVAAVDDLPPFIARIRAIAASL